MKKRDGGGRVSFGRRDVSRNRVKGFVLSFIPGERLGLGFIPKECFKKCLHDLYAI